MNDLPNHPAPTRVFLSYFASRWRGDVECADFAGQPVLGDSLRSACYGHDCYGHCRGQRRVVLKS